MGEISEVGKGTVSEIEGQRYINSGCHTLAGTGKLAGTNIKAGTGYKFNQKLSRNGLIISFPDRLPGESIKKASLTLAGTGYD